MRNRLSRLIMNVLVALLTGLTVLMGGIPRVRRVRSYVASKAHPGPIRVGMMWVYSDGTRIPVVAGGSTNFPDGLRSRGIPLPAGGIPPTGGDVFHVDSGNALASDDNDGKNPKHPMNQIDAAVGRCAPSNGDQIWVYPGHVETVVAGGDLDLDVVGITIIFLGNDNDRATIDFASNTGADMNVDASDITLINPRFTANIDGLTGPIDVNAARFKMYNAIYEDGASKATIDCIVADAAADDMLIDGWEYRVGSAGAQKQSNIQIAAADRPVLRNIRITGDFAVGAIENGTAWIDALLENVYLDNAATGPVVAILLQATSKGAMVNVYCRVASAFVAVTVNNDMQFYDCWGVGVDGEAAWPLGVGAYNVGVFPAAAAPADGVSGTEVLRRVHDEGIQLESIGEMDIDDDLQDYTSFQAILTIVPTAGAAIHDLVVHLDLDKTTTGFKAVYTTSKTIGFAVARKINGSDWRRDIDSSTTLRAEDLAGFEGQTIDIGSVGVDEEVRIEVIVNAEEGTDVEIPYAAYYRANAAATFTPIAA